MTFVVKCIPLMKKWDCCCCSCNMRSATTIIAWLYMFGALSSFLFNVVWLSADNHPSIVDMVAHHNMDEQTYNQFKIPKELIVSFLVVSLINLLIYGLLLHGIHKKRPGFMLPYIFLHLIGLILITIGIVIGGIILMIAVGAMGLLLWLFGGVYLAVMWFLWIVFYSYYRELEEELQPQTPHEVINYTYNMSNDRERLADQFDSKPYPA